MANGYALGQLSAAFLTATTHEDPAVRRRADHRAQHWARAIHEIAEGRVVVGSRAPVLGLPAWVTLDVLRGGFATGSAAAEIPLERDEIELAHRAGIPAERHRIFAFFLTDPGLDELNALLDSGGYRVEIPEDAALLTVAWLLRAGDREAALDILDALSPFTSRFRFTPKSASVAAIPPEFVFRTTAGAAAAILRSRKPNPRVEAQREALAVWNPFGDRVLALWLEKYVDGQVAVDADNRWRARAEALLDDYERRQSVHTLCSKHRKPKETTAILLRALKSTAEGGEPSDPGLLRRTIRDCVAKRGAPDSPSHVELRGQQRAVASTPGHSRLASVAAERLRELDRAAGIEHPEALTGEVTPEEAREWDVSEGSTMPPIVPRTLARAHAAPVEQLLDEGVVPSAEVLAELVPAISATIVASGFRDPALGRLAAANYRAFRRRRSLLLLHLSKQVQLSELPWTRAIARHDTATADEAMLVARRVGTLAVDRFPSTILPNPLIQELRHLLTAAGHDVPLVEELAADIFMGRFSDKFRRAAQTAAQVVGGTLYGRYFGIEPDQILALPEPAQPAGPRWPWRRARTPEPGPGFADMCRERAGRSSSDRPSVAANGTVIEQSQILTTHNLATLVALGIRPTRPWTVLARESIHRTASLLDLAARQRRPLATVKDAAYAWRQAVFYLSLATPSDAEALLGDLSVVTDGPAVMGTLLAGLRSAADGKRMTDDPRVPFLGWTVGRHWILDAIGHGSAIRRTDDH